MRIHAIDGLPLVGIQARLHCELLRGLATVLERMPGALLATQARQRVTPRPSR
jgi:hypothetical protein